MTGENQVIELLNTALASIHAVELCGESLAYIEDCTDPALNERGRNITRQLIAEYQAEKATETHELISKSLNILQAVN